MNLFDYMDEDRWSEYRGGIKGKLYREMIIPIKGHFREQRNLTIQIVVCLKAEVVLQEVNPAVQK